uniref:Secreted protein n=1 Tax=Rhizophora mucronata TaxID=61149 RepID=A0A2P2Q0Y5_RHIMU
MIRHILLLLLLRLSNFISAYTTSILIHPPISSASSDFNSPNIFSCILLSTWVPPPSLLPLQPRL